jgi:predicted permease
VIWSAVATPANLTRVQPGARRTAWLLLATLACVLLVAYANVLSVVLARRQERGRDLAVRRALGASSGRLLRQVVAEAMVLCGLAGTVALAAAPALLAALRRFAPDGLPSTRTGYVQISSFATPAVDGVVIAFGVAATLLAVILVVAIPVLDAARTQPAATLREDSRTGSRRRLQTLRAVVAAEMAVAAVLIAGATVLYASARGLERERQGFVPAGVLTARVAPPGSRYPPESGPEILASILAAAQAVPGVSLAAINRCAPLDPGCARADVYQAGALSGVPVERHYISADYFRVLGMRVVEGRGFTDEDRVGRPLVTVVNETAARRLWPGADPVGQHVWFSNPVGFDDPTHPVVVVGVVDDVKYGTVDDRLGPDFYTSYLQFAFPDSMILVKTAPGAGDGVMAGLSRAVARVDPDLPLTDPMSLEERVESAWATPRFHARAVLGFAMLALLLAAIGVYGVAAVAVSLRAREMGIRLAVGADPPAIVRLVLREHFRLGLVGGAVGLAISGFASRFLQGLLYDVSASDPRALGLAAIGLLAAAVLGAAVPARRAGAISPAALLRRD